MPPLVGIPSARRVRLEALPSGRRGPNELHARAGNSPETPVPLGAVLTQGQSEGNKWLWHYMQLDGMPFA